MLWNLHVIPLFVKACFCFQRLIELTVPDECTTELIPFPDTPPLAEVLVWQHGERLFSLRLTADHTRHVGASWQQFLHASYEEQKRLERSLTAQELRPLARSTLLDLLLAIDESG